jgi:hypothetical protein
LYRRFRLDEQNTRPSRKVDSAYRLDEHTTRPSLIVVLVRNAHVRLRIGTSLSFFGLPCLDVSLSARDETALLGQPNDKPDLQERCGVRNRVYHLREKNDLK